MYRIDNVTSIGSLPTPAAVGPNPNSYFTSGSAGGGTPATVVDQDWANAVQEEICYVIEQQSLTLSKTDRTQLLKAIKLVGQGSLSTYTTSTTAANTYTASLSPAPAAYASGLLAFIKFTNTNTGAATINLNSLGAKNIKRTDGSALNSGDIASGMIAILMYDGTNFQLLNAGVSPAVIQNNQYSYAADTGSANAYAIAISPAATAYTTGLTVYMKAANTNTTASTINVSSLGTKNIKLTDGSDPYVGAIVTGGDYILMYDGTNMQLLNPTTSKAIQNNVYSYAADSGSANAYACALTPALTAYAVGQCVTIKAANTNTAASTINVNSLGAKSIKLLNGGALVGSEIQNGGIYELIYDGTNFQLKNPFIQQGKLIGIQVFTSTGANTYTPTAGTKNALVELWGAGGGGGANNSASIFGAGGGGGQFVSSFVSVSGAVTINIGTGGNGQAANNGTAGTDGGDTTYNSTTIVAKGGSHGAATANGSGGTGGTGTIQITGGSGGIQTGGVSNLVPPGGSSPRLTQFSPIATFTQAGAANTGQGGSGGNNGNAGGAGGSGYAVVYEYA